MNERDQSTDLARAMTPQQVSLEGRPRPHEPHHPLDTPMSGVDTEPESVLLKRLFGGMDGALAMRLWNGALLRLGQRADEGEPIFTLVCRSPGVVRSMVLGRDPLRLVEAYFQGDIDIEGDFFAALGLKDQLQTIRLSAPQRLFALVGALRIRGRIVERDATDAGTAARQSPRVRAHLKQENRDAIAFHYDVSNEFYALWLDENMVYSCAYFEQPDNDLASAQTAKLEHICRKLRLKPGQRLLDIGCGWGALVMHAARHYGVHAHGITLSQRQLELARQKINHAGLQDWVTVELCDYRDLQGEATYDKISSVGMFEHVGLKNLPVYFTTVQRLLKPAGLFLNHGITHDAEGWKRTLSTEFINRYIFPDGQLDLVSNVQRAMERAGFEIADVESLRPHYANTLRHWVRKLEQHHEQALQFVSEETYRVWRLYMAACALQFEAGEIGVYQVLAIKRAAGIWPLPPTRRDLYYSGERSPDQIKDQARKRSDPQSKPQPQTRSWS